VTLSLTEAVWPRFAMQVFRGEGATVSSTEYSGQATLFTSSVYGRPKMYRVATIHALQTDRRQTDGHSIVP